jgi:hypothetical protein
MRGVSHRACLFVCLFVLFFQLVALVNSSVLELAAASHVNLTSSSAEWTKALANSSEALQLELRTNRNATETDIAALALRMAAQFDQSNASTAEALRSLESALQDSIRAAAAEAANESAANRDSLNGSVVLLTDAIVAVNSSLNASISELGSRLTTSISAAALNASLTARAAEAAAALRIDGLNASLALLSAQLANETTILHSALNASNATLTSVIDQRASAIMVDVHSRYNASMDLLIHLRNESWANYTAVLGHIDALKAVAAGNASELNSTIADAKHIANGLFLNATLHISALNGTLTSALNDLNATLSAEADVKMRQLNASLLDRLSGTAAGLTSRLDAQSELADANLTALRETVRLNHVNCTASVDSSTALSAGLVAALASNVSFSLRELNISIGILGSAFARNLSSLDQLAARNISLVESGLVSLHQRVNGTRDELASALVSLQGATHTNASAMNVSIWDALEALRKRSNATEATLLGLPVRINESQALVLDALRVSSASLNETSLRLFDLVSSKIELLISAAALNVSSLNVSVDSVRTSLAVVNKSTTETMQLFNAGLMGTNASVASVVASVSILGTSFNQSQVTFNTYSTKLDKLESEVHHIKANTSAEKIETDRKLQKTLSDVDERLREASVVADRKEAERAAYLDRVEAHLNKEVSIINSNAANLNERVVENNKQVENKLTQLEALVSSLATRLSVAETVMAQQQKIIDALQLKLEQTSKEAASETALLALRSEFTQLQGHIMQHSGKVMDIVIAKLSSATPS